MNSHVFWAAVQQIAAKRFDRDGLPEGTHPVSIRLSGKAGTTPIKESLDGSLIVNPSSDRVRDVPVKTVDILAALLYRLSPATRRRVLDAIDPQELASDEKAQLLAAEFLQATKRSKQETVRGSLAFAPAS